MVPVSEVNIFSNSHICVTSYCVLGRPVTLHTTQCQCNPLNESTRIYLTSEDKSFWFFQLGIGVIPLYPS